MKPFVSRVACLLVLAWLLPLAGARAQTPVFTYQGRLADAAGNPLSGAFDLTFKLYDAAGGGAQIGPTVATNGLQVAQGGFTVLLNFGAGAFPGADRWLEIAVRTNAGGAFTLLVPRQMVTSTPYALRAAEAGSAAGVAAGAVGSAALQNGAVDSSKIADGAISLADLSFTVASNTFWRLAGNSGTTPATQFLGTLDNQPLELRVNNQRALRLETNGSVALGRRAKVAHEGAFVWADAQNADFSSGGTNQFLIRANGGVGINVTNPASALQVGGTVTASGFVGNGAGLTGLSATALTDGTLADARLSGNVPRLNAPQRFGGTNTFAVGVGIGTTVVNALLDIGAPAGQVGLELSGSRSGNYAAPLSYIENTNTSGSSSPALRLVSAGNSPDGVLNVGSTGTGKLIAFGNAAGEVGNLNTNGQLTLKAGVTVDSPSLNSNVLSSGIQFGANSGEGIASARGAGPNRWGLDFYTYFLPRLSIAQNGNVGIGTNNPQSALQVVGTVTADRFVGDVQMTSITLPGTPLAGSVLTTDSAGTGNWNSGLRIVPTSTPGPGGTQTPATPNLIGGYGNVVSNGVVGATISGGGIRGLSAILDRPNAVGGDYGTVAGGADNLAGGYFSTVSGGQGNKATNQYATVPGGAGNIAGGKFSYAAGRRAVARHDGSFVWADSQNADFSSTGPDQFLIRAQGGVGIGIAPTDTMLNINGGVRLNDNDLFLRGGYDRNHGLGWYGGSTPYSGLNIDGPVLYGYGGGALGVSAGGEKAILTWKNTGQVEINTGNGAIQFINDLVPGLNLSGGTLPGILRFRNSLEVWPSQDGSREGKIDVRDTSGNATITLNGGSGQATVKVLEITGGADVAEPFPTSEPGIEPGTVMVIDETHPGRLTRSRQAYDTRVAGVVSGAGGIQPGIALRQAGVLEPGRNVALTGRVYVKADAGYGAIKPGDLLTTSDTPGHAMKVTEHARAQGAVLGKSMDTLAQGTGLVLVLVTLQ